MKAIYLDLVATGELEHQGPHYLAGEWRERYTRLAPVGGFFDRLIGHHYLAARTRRERLGWGRAAWTDPILLDPDEIPF